MNELMEAIEAWMLTPVHGAMALRQAEQRMIDAYEHARPKLSRLTPELEDLVSRLSPDNGLIDHLEALAKYKSHLESATACGQCGTNYAEEASATVIVSPETGAHLRMCPAFYPGEPKCHAWDD